MDIDRNNFKANYKRLVQLIENSDFISFDCEFSGLYLLFLPKHPDLNGIYFTWIVSQGFPQTISRRLENTIVMKISTKKWSTQFRITISFRLDCVSISSTNWRASTSLTLSISISTLITRSKLILSKNKCCK